MGVRAGWNPTPRGSQRLPDRGWRSARVDWMLGAIAPRRCAMTESMGGVVPLGDMLAGINADVIGEHDPAGETFIRLLDAVERHASLEAEALGQYEHLAQASGDPVIALAMRLILENEERHHSLLKRIASTPRDALNWTYTPDALPRATTSPAAT